MSLSFLTDSIIHTAFFASIVASIFSMLPILPSHYRILVQVIGLVISISAAFFEGKLYTNDQWSDRVKTLELAVAKAEAKAANATVQVVTKYVIEKQIVKEKGDIILDYIDREVVKYNNICVIPKEAIIAHNSAVKLNPLTVERGD